MRQAKVPQAVQLHLPKCFDGIFSLEFGHSGGEAAATANDILAMVSIEGEKVAFSRTLKVGATSGIQLCLLQQIAIALH